MADVGSLEHLHCPSCDHCIAGHKLFSKAETADGQQMLYCVGCHKTAHFCPARNHVSSQQDTLRLIYIHTMREFIKETGL